MRIGIHLPQFGAAVAAGGVERAAREAEELGFDDLWVSDHLVVAADMAYPAPEILDPLQALAFAAAATEHIGIGTSVIVAPQYPSPLALAKSIASLDVMSGGRLILGLGSGWSVREYEALGGNFDHRGPRLEEIIRLFRTAWEHDPVDYEGEYYPSFEQIRVLPAPAHRIPIWLGGFAPAAMERALANDGYHGIMQAPEQCKDLVAQLRERRPEPEFVISMRVAWDISTMDAAEMRDEADAYRDAGIDALILAPHEVDFAEWTSNQGRAAQILIG